MQTSKKTVSWQRKLFLMTFWPKVRNCGHPFFHNFSEKEEEKTETLNFIPSHIYSRITLQWTICDTTFCSFWEFDLSRSSKYQGFAVDAVTVLTPGTAERQPRKWSRIPNTAAKILSYKRSGDFPHLYIKINTLNHSLVAKKKLRMTRCKSLNERHSEHF